MNIYSYNPTAKYKSNRGSWPLGITNLEHQELYVSRTQHISVAFPQFTKYPIKVPTNLLNDPVNLNWKGRALDYWNIQVNVACHCATTALGISAKHMSGSVPIVNSIFKFHVYYYMRRILARMKVSMPYEGDFSQYENSYSTSGYTRVCREYGANPNDLYKFKALVSSLTNGRWWPQVDGDWAKLFIPTSQGLTSEGLTKLSESIRVYVILLLGSQATSKASILGSKADNFTARQILLQKFEAMVQRDENVGQDITEFQKVLQYARTPVNFAVMSSVYMLPSNMDLRIGKIVGYNSNILIAPSDIGVGVKLDLNTKAVKHEASFTTPPRQHIKKTTPDTKEAAVHEEAKGIVITVGVYIYMDEEIGLMCFINILHRFLFLLLLT
ncbi:uncharacterized protein LOC130654364 [Hydractinia symbiolongicarpus]|uniref:uncharacterized protein LOC130654364 n=1 Tax=Hydractinia symbiolongicarpus TaxID=13093 RepID=UPI00254A2493|nr:uncharacterized protein LOC130654364 [Hydractinia symbiolongicarpus]XP_057312912.1 uncharacterized protein LOC130654364 [Hydractinia symbiolongicarpus]